MELPIIAGVRRMDDRLLAAAKLLIMILIAGSLMMGIWASIGVPEPVIKFFFEAAAVLVLLIVALATGLPTFALLSLAPLVGISLIGLFSGLGGEDGLLGAALLARDALKYAILLPVGAALVQDEPLLKSAAVVACGLLLLQPLVAVWKLAALGVDETGWIGTLHQTAGEFGLLVPLIVVAVVVPPALMKRWELVLLIFPFVFFGIINEKRAMTIMIPCVLAGSMLVTLLYRAFLKRDGRLREAVSGRFQILVAVVGIIASITCFYGSARLIPSLNPQEKIGGEFSTAYVVDYLAAYATRDYNHPLNRSPTSVELNLNPVAENPNIQLGRIRMLFESGKYILGQPVGVMLFGLGAGAVSETYLLGDDRTDIVYEKLGLRGVVPFGLRILLETGLAGLFLFVAWFAIVAVMLLRALPFLPIRIAIVFMIILGIHAVVAFDVFLYSSATWVVGPLSPSYFLAVGAAIAAARSARQPSRLIAFPDHAACTTD